MQWVTAHLQPLPGTRHLLRRCFSSDFSPWPDLARVLFFFLPLLLALHCIAFDVDDFGARNCEFCPYSYGDSYLGFLLRFANGGCFAVWVGVLLALIPDPTKQLFQQAVEAWI